VGGRAVDKLREKDGETEDRPFTSSAGKGGEGCSKFGRPSAGPASAWAKPRNAFPKETTGNPTGGAVLSVLVGA